MQNHLLLHSLFGLFRVIEYGSREIINRKIKLSNDQEYIIKTVTRVVFRCVLCATSICTIKSLVPTLIVLAFWKSCISYFYLTTGITFLYMC